MEIREFKSTQWGANMCCEYMGEKMAIASVNFKEHLIGMVDQMNPDDELIWARCENCELT